MPSATTLTGGPVNADLGAYKSPELAWELKQAMMAFRLPSAADCLGIIESRLDSKLPVKCFVLWSYEKETDIDIVEIRNICMMHKGNMK